MRICFVGDSQTLGTGDAAMLGWPGRLGAMAWSLGHEITVYNLGVRGDTSEDIRQRWRSESARRLPAGMNCALVFAFGLNDCVVDGVRQRVTLEQTLCNARAILNEACAWQPSLFIGLLPVDDSRVPPQTVPGGQARVFNTQIEKANSCLADLMRELRVPNLDFFSPLFGDQAWQEAMALGDGVHPSQQGYQLVAQRIWNWRSWRQLLGLDGSANEM